MLETVGDDLASRLRRAYANHDMDAFGELLSDDVTWGDVDHPRGCRNRGDVLARYGQSVAAGMDGRIGELATGSDGILCELSVEWPDDHPRASDRNLFHVYMVRDGRIREIRRYDDRESAAAAAGVM